MDIAGKILDLHDDPSASLIKQAVDAGIELPSYFSEMPHEAFLASDAEALPDSCFAWVTSHRGRLLRKFACDSKVFTWGNGLYFLKKGHHIPRPQQAPIAQKLAQFYDLHGIEKPALLMKIAAGEAYCPPELPQIAELPEECYALVEDGQKRYPIASWHQVKAAEAYFDEFFQMLPPAHRRQFATKVAQRVRTLAQQTIQETLGLEAGDVEGHGLSPSGQEKVAANLYAIRFIEARKAGYDPARLLDARLQKYASYEAVDDEVLKAEIALRLKMAGARASAHLGTEGETVALQAIDTYRQIFDNRGSLTLDKVGQMLETVDRALNFDRHWGARLRDPYDAFTKVASDPEARLLHDAPMVTVRQLRKLAERRELLTRRFDDFFADEMARDPVAAFEVLPPEEKQAVAEMAHSA